MPGVRVPSLRPKTELSKGWLCFLVKRDSKPERVFALIKYACGIFLAKRCEVRYRNAKHLGGRAGQIAKQYAVPSLRPKNRVIQRVALFFIIDYSNFYKLPFQPLSSNLILFFLTIYTLSASSIRGASFMESV